MSVSLETLRKKGFVIDFFVKTSTDQVYANIISYNNITLIVQTVSQITELLPSVWLSFPEVALLKICKIGGEGSLKMVEALLEAGVDPNVHEPRDAKSEILRESKGKNPIELTCERGDIELIELLIKYKANFKNVNILETYILKNKIDSIKELIQKGVDINEVSKEYNTNALFWAINTENIEIVKYLLDKGINTNIISSYGLSPLMYCIFYGNLEIFELLVKRKINLTVKVQEIKDPYKPHQEYEGLNFMEVLKKIIETAADKKKFIGMLDIGRNIRRY